tara:strand:+ start:536 stop:1258 length:723 start_codon:yes stop_codon:yes gene_type:complete
MKKKILIVLPTLNEDRNISVLYKKIRSLRIPLDLLFIDDGSNDNTIEIIKKIAKNKNKKIKIFLKKRYKRLGIGKAHKDGLNFGYKKKYNFAITMDSDLAHDPKYINNLLKHSQKFDLVLGSRFLAKKSYENLSLIRIFLSEVAHFFTKFLFGHKFDSTNAFRCYNLKKINKDFLKECKSNHYDFFFTSITILNYKKHSIHQFPMTISGRSYGSTKMELKHAIRSFLMMFRLFFQIKIKI